jgi:phenylacetate-CoA ligase
MIILRGVNVFPTQIEEQLMATDGLAPHFQIELYREGRMDAMRVSVEADLSATDADSRNAAGKALRDRIKTVVGVSTDIVVSEPGGVPRSQGKAMRVVDNRKGER